MEMHIVSRNKNYSTIAEALTHDDGLAVLAFFFNVIKFYNNYSSLFILHCIRIFKHLSKVMIYLISGKRRR